MEIKIALGLRETFGREREKEQRLQQFVLSLAKEIERRGKREGAENVQEESNRMIARTQKNIHFLESDARLSEGEKTKKEEEEREEGR